MCRHEILKYAAAETQSMSLILSQLERMKKAGEAARAAGGEYRHKKARMGRLKVGSGWLMQAGGLYHEAAVIAAAAAAQIITLFQTFFILRL